MKSANPIDSSAGSDLSDLINLFCLNHHLHDRSGINRDLHDICRRLGDYGIVRRLLEKIESSLYLIPDPAAALTGLDRLVSNQPDPLQFILSLIEKERTFQRLLQCLGTSTFFMQTIISQLQEFPDLFQLDFNSSEFLRIEALAVIMPQENETHASDALRRFRQRITLAIGAADLFEHTPLSQTTLAISNLADACLNAALSWSISRNIKKYGQPRSASGVPCRLVAMALGKLGGQELNYSSDVDLIFIYDEDGQTPGQRPLPARDFFSRVITDFLKVMSGPGGSGFVLRVDLRLRPEGAQGPMLMNLEQTINYYESIGRTWERQALIKIRPCAGDISLGFEFQSRIEPFIYRRFLNSVEIAEIQAMKRRIEHRSQLAGVAETDVKTGYGGIRDVEFVVQFLQLLNGCTLQKLRCNNTLQALINLKETNCITPEEHYVMRRNYIFLRNIEHRLQLMDDRQTHRIPASGQSKLLLARLMGYQPLNAWESADAPFERFHRDYQKTTVENREILNRLLHNTFQMESEHGPDLVTDLILDPEMPVELIEQALSPFHFKDQSAAIRLLGFMAREEKPYFSTPRCRHFFAALAPKLVHCISQTTDPDFTLNNIEAISRPVSGKVALWECLIRSNKLLESLVEIAAYKKLTIDLLTARSDAWESWSESVDQPFQHSLLQIDQEIQKNSNGSGFNASVLRSIRDQSWLGISSALKLPMTPEDTLMATSAVAVVAKNLIVVSARRIWYETIQRWRNNISKEFLPGNWAIVALGKLGGSDLLFHSDLDLLFLHEINPELKSDQLKQSAEMFFQEIATKLIRTMGETGNSIIYRIDTRLRPYGNSGPLSVSTSVLKTYYGGSQARIWEKLALLRSRPIVLNGFDENEMKATLHRLSFGSELDQETIVNEICILRRRTLSDSDSAGYDLKRASGGLHELELIVQGLQLSGYQILVEPPSSHIHDAIDQLQRIRLLDDSEASILKEGYFIYRQIELALRLYRNRCTNTIEIQAEEIAFLEKMICDRSSSAEMPLLEKLAFHRKRIGQLFQARFSSAGPPKVSATI